jgi:hypothetical protein
MSTFANFSILFDIFAILLMAVGAVAILFSMFQPLLKGAMRATMLFAQKKTSPEQVRQMHDAKMLRQMADSVDKLEPGFAAELRAIAARN